MVKKEQHRTTLAAVTQDNANFYKDEVAQLKATREWDIDYWMDQMNSMMHTAPAVALKL